MFLKQNCQFIFKKITNIKKITFIYNFDILKN